MEPKFYIGDYIYAINCEEGCVENARIDEIIIKSEQINYKLAECTVNEICEDKCFSSLDEAKKALFKIIFDRLSMSNEEVIRSVEQVYLTENDEINHDIYMQIRIKVRLFKSLLTNIKEIADYPNSHHTFIDDYAQAAREHCHKTLEDIEIEIHDFLNRKESER